MCIVLSFFRKSGRFLSKLFYHLTGRVRVLEINRSIKNLEGIMQFSEFLEAIGAVFVLLIWTALLFFGAVAFGI